MVPSRLEARTADASYEILPATSPISIDGALDEEAWSQALALELPYETWPGENLPAPVHTEAYLTYDEENLYAAFRASDPEPTSIRAHFSDRDRAWQDDLVGISLDTFNDERGAYEFLVNPLGVQIDMFNDSIGRGGGTAWDAIWYSAGRITEEGYVVEMAIPFSSFRFPKSQGAQVWGVDAMRFYPRSRRHRMGTVPLDPDSSCYLCQVSKVAGFDRISPGRNLELLPSLTAGRTDSQDETATGLLPGDVVTDLGLTVSWGFTPGLMLNAAVNPDFSQVEADVAQLDVNRQFALFFPEKRPFFLEGADVFSTPLNVVHTRSVADPDWGLKLTGKQGRNGLGVFVAEDEVTHLILPGSLASQSTSLAVPNTSTVVRYRRDVGQNSSLGFLLSDRDAGEYANRVAGVDAFLRITGSDSLRLQWLGSETRYPASLATEFEQPASDLDDRALRIEYNHVERNWWWELGYDDIGSQFRADLGFLPRVDLRSYHGSLGRVWRGGEDRWWSRLNLETSWDLTKDHQGQELERSGEVGFGLNGPRQSHFHVELERRRRFWNGRTFEEKSTSFRFGVQPSATLSFFVFGRRGDGIDFTHTRPGQELRLSPTLNLNLGRHIRFNLRHTLNQLDVQGGELFQASLSELRFIYQFNVRTFIRAIWQYTDIARNLELYADPVSPTNEHLFTQLLFSYKLNPRTVLFVGYSDNRAGDLEIDLTQTDRSLFLKLGYAWGL